MLCTQPTLGPMAVTAWGNDPIRQKHARRTVHGPEELRRGARDLAVLLPLDGRRQHLGEGELGGVHRRKYSVQKTENIAQTN